jgi:NAD(P)-dependent dehydrogenase (short-subunit alcohol dehydrogenase family)
LQGRGRAYDAAVTPAKTILVTGAGRGLGLATSMKLARAGHQVVLAVRDRARGEQAAAEIRGVVPGCQLEVRTLDLAALASVRAFAAALVGEGRVVDVLLHNAGVMQQSRERRVTVDGFEETLAVNTLAPFLLTRELLPALARSSAARVVCVASMLHMPGSRGEPVNFDFADPQLLRGYHPDRAYKNSKLALLWWTYELQRRLPPRPITANAVCPGFVPVTAAASVRARCAGSCATCWPTCPSRARSSRPRPRWRGWPPTRPSRAWAASTSPTSPSCLERRLPRPGAGRRFWGLACECVGACPTGREGGPAHGAVDRVGWARAWSRRRSSSSAGSRRWRWRWCSGPSR